ncbi:MAG: DUF4959 domain-containing protein, partial [Bacteroidetes bacterium]|nr:DUF4959 domain-containing protein [Bacteroidota bacterium]
MMQFKNRMLCAAIGLVFSAMACKKTVHSSLFPDGDKPAPLTGTSVVNGPGSATITYSLPGDNSILYV